MMYKLRTQVEILATKYAYGPPAAFGIDRRTVEEELWSIVEQAMKVQQEICGGHK